MGNHLLIAAVLCCSMARSADPSTTKALQQTQQTLRDPAQRQKAVEADAPARQVHEHVVNLMGNSQNVDELYDIAADLTADLVKETGGNSVEMLMILEKAQKNPEEFARMHISSKLKERIRSLSHKVDPRAPAGK